MSDVDSSLAWLCSWYASQADGDWEHGYGMRVETLDNPGWSLTIDLSDTSLEGASFERTELEAAERSGSILLSE